MRVARVFPRRTNATPADPLAFIGPPPDGLEVDAVNVSVTFTYDRDRGHQLAEEWGNRYRLTSIAGPAFGDRGEDFVAGMYLKRGYVITSRGCPNQCWFCDVPGREGREMRELPIVSGWDVLDSNLLACTREHINAVFNMLATQTKRVRFTGGLEAARLQEWHVNHLWHLRPEYMFFAYDTPTDLKPLRRAGEMLRRADFTRRHLRCYVLIGYESDTFQKARQRLLAAWDAGFMPMAMLWAGQDGATQDSEWRSFQRVWARPAITKRVVRDLVTNVEAGPKAAELGGS